ncbi:19499_t:CDS:2, partial [Racocetra persica]
DYDGEGYDHVGEEVELYTKYKNYKTVALKALSNSQNLNQDFLQELTLYKMFRSEVSNMVPCYGISKDLEGNYIMVMEFMKEGDLREYLRKNYRELKFYSDEYGKTDKLKFLRQITQGLKDIHHGLYHSKGDLKTDTEFYQQYEEAKNHNKTLPDEIKHPTYHSSETWHSKPINTKQITKLLQGD